MENSISQFKESQFCLNFFDEKELLVVEKDSRKYEFEFKNENVKSYLESSGAFEILFNAEEFAYSYNSFKNSKSFPEIDKIIKFDVYAPIDYYLDTLEHLVDHLKVSNDKSKFTSDTCSICMDEHYEGILEYSSEKIRDYQLKSQNPCSIKLEKCSNHSFHSDCVLDYMKSQLEHQCYFKCPVCSRVYGNFIGDQPPGKMTINLNNKMKCSGYENVGTYIIQYYIEGGTRRNKNFSGTSRSAYIPDTPEGREVLSLLKKAFMNKQIFTVGDSITTGAKHVVVWNGIHHKTSLSGGSSCFGYPDETYFARVKIELADKGVIIEKEEKVEVKESEILQCD